MSGDPSQPNYYGYNFYHVQTDFEYVGLHSDLGHGWILDNKVYTYRYWNKQNYNGSTISATSATDKLNGYRRVGDTLAVSKEWSRGILRTGLWYEWTYTDRYQIPSDPRTWADAALPNFHEHFITLSAQPYLEYEYRLTPKLSWDAGIKYAHYTMDLKQFADNGKTVGSLGGLPFVTHEANYSAWNPSTAMRYHVRSNWSVYGQFAIGSVIPPSSVFDSTGAQVAVLPKPTSVKTYQAGTVLKFQRWTLDFDGYYSHFQNPYASFVDPVTTESYFYQTGPSNTKGVEGESNIQIGHGLSLYLNASLGKAAYQQTDLWVANTPHDTEAIGVTYRMRGFDLGFIDKRVGSMWNDNGTINQAVPIDPFNIANLFLNYTVRGDSWLRGTKIRFGINNLQNNHNIVGVTPASAKSNAPAPGDVLTIVPARSFSVTMTFGYAPKG
jgi:iron complex outermembrane receptor protein